MSLLVASRQMQAALRNYAAAVLWRENQQIVSAAIFLTLVPVVLVARRHDVARHSLAVLLHGRGGLLYPWWMLTWILPSCMAHHYWRQVRATMAVAIPGFIEAELAAIRAVMAAVLLVLALPLIALGAPLPGAMALAAVGIVLGIMTGGTGQTGQTGVLRALRGLLFLPFILVGLIPGAIEKVVFAPWPVDGAIFMVAGLLIFTGLRFHPAMAAWQDAVLEHRRDGADKRAGAGRGGAWSAVLRAIMAWRPGFMGENPLPLSFGMSIGPVGAMFLLSVQCGILVVVLPVIGLVIKGGHFIDLMRQSAPQTLAVFLGVSTMTSGLWLLRRGEWPFFFCAGIYGGRQGFARGMFAAFRLNILQTTLIELLIILPVGWVLGVLPASQLAPAGLVIFAMLYGASYAPALPLLWRELGGKGVMVALNFVGYVAVLCTAQFLVFGSHVKLAAFVVAATLLVLGLLVSVYAPRKLATMDWPLEVEAEQSE